MFIIITRFSTLLYTHVHLSIYFYINGQNTPNTPFETHRPWNMWNTL